MADHNELVGELFLIEKLSTAERLKHAKKRRSSQMKKWNTYDKQCEKDDNRKRKSTAGKRTKKSKTTTRIRFEDGVAFLEAASRNDVEEVRQLLMKGVSPDVANQDGLTAMHQCCIDDSEEMLKLLIEFGANLNAQDTELWTPLHAAATCGHIHLCKYLIENHAELLAVNADGNMPYDICEDERTLDYIESEMAKRAITQEDIDNTRLSAERFMLDELKILAENGKDLEFKDKHGATPLHIASANGYLSVAEFLLDHHVAVNCQDNDSWQPIHAAACWGQPVMLELLIQNGADVDAKTKNGETPHDICEDPDFKQRITDIKEEMSNHRQLHKTELTRKRSHNTRSIHASTGSLYSSNTSLSDKNPLSASVRRTSMREKTMISWKEARSEAMMIGVHPDGSSDNNNVNGSQGLEKLPMSNIDEIQITLDAPEDLPDDDDDDDEIPAQPEKVAEQNGQTNKKESVKSNKDTNHRAIIQVSPDSPKRSVKDNSQAPPVQQPPVIKIESPKDEIDKRASTKVSVKVSSQEVTDSNKGVVVASSNKATVSVKTGSDSKEVKTLENLKMKEANLEKTVDPPREIEKSPAPAAQKVVVRVTQGDGDPGSIVKPDSSVISDNGSDMSQSSSINSNMGGRRTSKGTLTELKKQRAAQHREQITNSLRLRDSSKLEAELTAMGTAETTATANYDSPAQPVPAQQPPTTQQNSSNGNGAVANNTTTPPRQTLYIPPHGPMGGEKRYKFSATNNEVIGNDETTDSCCLIM